MIATTLTSKKELGIVAAQEGVQEIRRALAEKGKASIILATGASQFDTLAALCKYRDLDWQSVTVFHLDEYIGLDEAHPASFVRYLKQRFVSQVPDIKAFHAIDGLNDPEKECERLKQLIRNETIDVAFIGIGENGHIAFNDPPADFSTKEPYLLVNLDEECRRQQFGEGWFSSLDEVPKQAISMSVSQILKSSKIIVSVPDKRKAIAVKNTMTQCISPLYPSTALRNHAYCRMYLDESSASLLSIKSNIL